MSEIIVVRQSKCEGCLYSPTAVARNAREGREMLKMVAGSRFHCHCHALGDRVLCRGFYDAHKDRLPKQVRFTKKKGRFWQWWLGVKAGTALFWGWNYEKLSEKGERE